MKLSMEALAIGEAAAADTEQQEMLAGKFKDAEELEKAYIELQKKLGEGPMKRNQKKGCGTKSPKPKK